MARKLRVKYPGAIYHLMNRRDRCEPIFKDDADRACFLENLGQCRGKTEWQVHAWFLVNSHFNGSSADTQRQAGCTGFTGS